MKSTLLVVTAALALLCVSVTIIGSDVPVTTIGGD